MSLPEEYYEEYRENKAHPFLTLGKNFSIGVLSLAAGLFTGYGLIMSEQQSPSADAFGGYAAAMLFGLSLGGIGTGIGFLGKAAFGFIGDLLDNRDLRKELKARYRRQK